MVVGQPAKVRISTGKVRNDATVTPGQEIFCSIWKVTTSAPTIVALFWLFTELEIEPMMAESINNHGMHRP